MAKPVAEPTVKPVIAAKDDGKILMVGDEKWLIRDSGVPISFCGLPN
ncbi:hypothetical protein [Candidatus Phyllobacterium onerii]|nr:hypothetical protein [Phyllobacterium sp. IY22]